VKKKVLRSRPKTGCLPIANHEGWAGGRAVGVVSSRAAADEVYKSGSVHTKYINFVVVDRT
jgi:hypothetical protein